MTRRINIVVDEIVLRGGDAPEAAALERQISDAMSVKLAPDQRARQVGSDGSDDRIADRIADRIVAGIPRNARGGNGA